MKNKILFTLIMLFASICTSFSQDFIELKDGSEIKSKIIELSPTKIKYDNLNGQIVMIDKAQVRLIRYETGKIVVINTGASPSPSASPSPIVTTTESKAVEQPAYRQEPTTQYAKGFGSIFIGGTMPLGDYAVSEIIENEKAAGAVQGFNVGLQLGYRFSPKASILLEGQYALNAYEMQFEDVRYIYKLRGDWTFINIMPSLRFDAPIGKNVSLYSMFSGGVSFAEVKGDFGEVLTAIESETKATTFCYGATVGLVFAKHINLGVKYFATAPDFSGYKPTVSMIQGTIGYQF